MNAESKESLERQYVARSINWKSGGTNVILVNICDEELLGTTIRGEQVDMPISKEYYGGEKVSEIEAIDLVRNSSIVSLAGTRIVSKVVEAKLASGKAVKRFGDVSFLMIYKF